MIHTNEVLNEIEAKDYSFNELKSSIKSNDIKFSEYKSWFAMIFHFLNILLMFFLLTKINFIILKFLCSYLIALSFTGLFVLVHDCGHYSFSKIKILNDIVGQILTSMFFINYYSWIVGHNHHHRFSNIKGYDTNWTEKMMTIDEYQQANFLKKLEYKLSYGSIFGLLIGNIYAMTRYCFIPWSYPQTKEYVSNNMIIKIWFANFSLISLSSFIVWKIYTSFGMEFLFFSYLLPYMISSFFGALFTYLHHVNEQALVFNKENSTALRSQIVSTYDIRFPAHIEWFCHDINIHLVHHLNPKVPWYNLKKATKNFQETFPKLYQSEKFSWNLLINSWKKPCLEFQNDKKVFNFIKAP